MKLKVNIERDESGYYVAEVPTFPGCVSQGRTLNEVRTNIKEANPRAGSSGQRFD